MSRTLAMACLLAFLLPLASAGAASAQYREFTGKIQKMNQKKLIVDNRMGDKVTFERLKETKVEDASGGKKPKAQWTDLKHDDWVTVKWKMVDKPRKAYEIIVLPPKDEAGDDL